MITIKIESLDIPTTFAYTNTGLQPYPTSKEEIIFFEHNPNVESVYLEYDQDWRIFGNEIMQVVSWYTRTFFSCSKNINIKIVIE